MLIKASSFDSTLEPFLVSANTHMNHGRTEPTPLRSVPFCPPPNEVSSFDLEYALLENALRKDRSPFNTPKIPDEAKSRKCSSPPLLEPEFYFGDILGDEAVPPQVFLTITKEEGKIHQPHENHVEQSSGFVNDGSRLPLSENNPTGSIKYRSHASENPETDLSTALASLVSSHVSSETLSPKVVAHLEERFTNNSRPGRRPLLSSRRRAPESSSERRKQFARPIHTTAWAPYVGRFSEQLSNLESNAKTVMASVLGADQISHEQPESSNGTTEMTEEIELSIPSPISDSSMTGPGIRSHPDLYENLSPEIRQKVDGLRQKISSMPRRKLRESLAQGVTLEDVEPLMCLNRDELAGMLGLGVTTLKMFVHNTLGVPRWPARALKSQKVKVQKLFQKKLEAERRGDHDLVKRVQRDLKRMTDVQNCGKKLLRKDGKFALRGGITKKEPA